MKTRLLTVEVKKSLLSEHWFFHFAWTNGEIGLSSECYSSFPKAFKSAMKFFHLLAPGTAKFVVPPEKQPYLARYWAEPKW